MTAISLLLQSALLVLVAYFLGAWLGCVLRRLASRGRTETTVAEATAAAGAVASSETATRFNQALAGHGRHIEAATVRPTEPPPVAPQPAPPPSQSFEPVAPTIETIPDRPEPEPTARANEPAGAAEVDTVQAAPVPQKDDLSLIRGVDGAALETLAAAGIRSFAQLGALKAEEVRRLDDALGSRGRIARENWIEQAQMLAADRSTAYAMLRGGQAGVALASPTPDEGTPLTFATSRAVAEPASEQETGADEAGAIAETPQPAAASASAVTPTAPPTPGEATSVSPDEDLQRIAGITPEIDGLLKSRGIRRYSQIAGWSSDDVQRIETLLGVPGRVANENWVGQARALTGEPDPADAATGAPEAHDLLSAAGIAPAANLVGLRSVKSPAFTGGETAQPVPAGPSADLKRIRGIGVMIEKRLHMLGVHSYEQIANWTRSDIDRVSRELEFKGRIERENWVEQARILVAGGQTNFSRRFDSRSSSN